MRKVNENLFIIFKEMTKNNTLKYKFLVWTFQIFML